MSELVLVLGPLALLLGLTLLGWLVSAQTLGFCALLAIGVGSLLGLPCGLAYHLVLRRELARASALSEGWYWHPQRLHGRLESAAKRRVLPWFVLGALGFGLINLGFLLAVTALALWFRGEGAAMLG